jgi:TonB family protein
MAILHYSGPPFDPAWRACYGLSDNKIWNAEPMNQALISQSFPRRLCAGFVFLAVLAGPAQAQSDRLLPVQADGSMPDVPARFGRANLTVQGLGSEKPLVRLRIGAHETTLPSCIARLIRSENLTQVQAAGSWRHALRKNGLPYYLSITFSVPDADPQRMVKSKLHFLFNLNDATLISAGAFEAGQSGLDGRFNALSLPAACHLNAPQAHFDAHRRIASHEAISRAAAAIDQAVTAANLRPRKTFISPSTREVGYALYYKQVARRIEEIGTRDFPQKDGKRLYGQLIVYIPIFQDGHLYMKDGGPRIEKSSGNADLDRAALAIVQSAAPFGPIPPAMRSPAADDVWILVSGLDFAHREAASSHLETK